MVLIDNLCFIYNKVLIGGFSNYLLVYRWESGIFYLAEVCSGTDLDFPFSEFLEERNLRDCVFLISFNQDESNLLGDAV